MVACSAGGDRTGPTGPTDPEATTRGATTPDGTAPPVPTEPIPVVVVVAVGDISCPPQQPVTEETCQMAATAELATSLRPDAVLAVGDLQYPDGRTEYFRESFDRTWGTVVDIRPAPGNHEYQGGSARGYFEYFDARDNRAGDPPGWYAHDLGSWRAYALNSVCWAIEGCGAGSPQVEWLRRELAAQSSRCELAYWHHARFSSGLHGDDPSTATFWEVLHEAGVDVVLAAHDHHYERFAPLDPEGRPDPAGIRQFVAGTGGRSLYPVGERRPGSEVAVEGRFGVLELTLRPETYSWRFLAAPDGEVLDAGSAPCR